MRRLLRSLFDGGHADDVAVEPEEPDTSSIGHQDRPRETEAAAVEIAWAKDAARSSPLREQLSEISLMNGVEFERFTARVFEALGYDATLVGGAGDQGVDLVLRKGAEVVAVQCKN